MSQCEASKPCITLTALMTDGIVNYCGEINLPGFPDPFVGIVIKGRTFMVNGAPVIDSHILNYCPGCGAKFMDFIDQYAPPLVQEKYVNKPKLVIT